MSNEQLKDAVKEAVSNSLNTQRQVYQLTVEALKTTRLNADDIGATVQAVFHGAAEGAEQFSGDLRESLTDARKGVEEALEIAAEASKQAIEQAAGRATEFTREEMTEALSALEKLETTYLDSLNEVTKSVSENSRKIYLDMVEEAAEKGTEMGNIVTENFDNLQAQVSEISNASVDASMQMAQQASKQFNDLTQQFFDNLTGAFQPRDKDK